MKRFKAFFGYRSRVPDKIDAPQASVYKESEDVKPSSEEQTTLDSYPSAWPPLQVSASELRTRYCAYIAQVVPLETPVTNEKLQLAGQRLARELFETALDLSYSKAQEFSPDIYWLIQSAAIVSLFADGPHSNAFADYLRYVQYYKNFNSAIAQVAAFEKYVNSR